MCVCVCVRERDYIIFLYEGIREVLATVLSMFVRISYNLYSVGTSKSFNTATCGINPFSAIVAKNEEEQRAYWPTTLDCSQKSGCTAGYACPDLTVTESWPVSWV